MKEFLNSLIAKMAEFATVAGMRILATVAILVVGSKLIKWILRRIQKNKKFDALTSNSKVLIIDVLKVAMYVLLFVIIASTLGIETASITAAIASAGLAVGLALQGSLSNFAGGIMILAFKPFSIGDYIDTGSHAGTVTDIGIFYTTLETLDNKVVTIPNGVLSNQSVTDFSTKEIRRLDLNIGVAYDSDIELVKQTLVDLAMNHTLVLKEPEPFARLGEQGDSALVFYWRVWVKPEHYWAVNFDLLEQSKKALDEKGISIPFPQMDVHIDGNN